MTFTSESVTEGHPDKLADRISDAILDAHMSQDPGARVACETLVSPGRVHVAGEITSNAEVDHEAVVRDAVRSVGYDRRELGFWSDGCEVVDLIHGQANEIASLVNDGGAGDQGLMFGYACSETPEMMPMPIHLAHRLAERLAQVRHTGALPWLRPDGKTQVTIEYRGQKPYAVHTVVVACQHDPEIGQAEVRREIQRVVVDPVLPAELLLTDPTVLINHKGSFVQGGPAADCGLTGRKIIVDTYGGAAPHGGGAFSGKDATKVDRSAAYMARHIAKHLVASNLAERAMVQLAYVIGGLEPLSVLVDTYGTGSAPDDELEHLVRRTFPLQPAAICEHLQLAGPIFTPTSAYGHFGRPGFSWETTT